MGFIQISSLRPVWFLCLCHPRQGFSFLFYNLCKVVFVVALLLSPQHGSGWSRPSRGSERGVEGKPFTVLTFPKPSGWRSKGVTEEEDAFLWATDVDLCPSGLLLSAGSQRKLEVSFCHFAHVFSSDITPQIRRFHTTIHGDLISLHKQTVEEGLLSAAPWLIVPKCTWSSAHKHTSAEG